MATAFYLALTDGTTTVTLTDSTKSRFNHGLGCEFIPNVPVDLDDVPGDIEDVIVVQVVGATAYAIRQNLRALTKLLQQANRWAKDRHSSVSPVVIKYTPPGSAPARVYTALITGWNPDEYVPADYNHRIETSRDILLTIKLTHRSPWLHTAWTNNNLLTNTAGMGAWVGTPTAVANNALVGAYGGTGSIRSTTGGGAQNADTSNYIPITAGLTYTIIGTYGGSGIGSLDITFRDATGALSRATTATVSIVNTTVAKGATFTATVVASTTDATAILRVSFTGSAGQYIDLAEILVMDGAVTGDVWHRTYTEETVSSTSAAANSGQQMQVSWQAATAYLSPVSVALGNFSATANPKVGTGYLITLPEAGSNNYALEDFPTTNTKTVAPFSTVNDSAQRPYGGTNITRYTPTGTTKISVLTAPEDIVFSALAVKGSILAFLSVRNNSSTTSFYLSVKYSRPGGSSYETTPVKIEPYTGSAAPQIVPIGAVWSDDGWTTWELFAEASAASGSLDMDELLVIQASPGTAVMSYGSMTLASGSGYSLKADPRLASAWRPFLGLATGETLVNATPNGDPYPMVSSDAMIVLWFATYATYWRHVDDGTAGDPLTSATAVCTRTPAFILPE